MDPPPTVTPVPLLVVFGLAIWAAVAVWAVVYGRLRAGLPLLPVQPRRQVPWHGVDMAMIVLFYMGSAVIMGGLAYLVLGSEAIRPLADRAEDVSDHIVVQLFRRGGNGSMIACFLAAAVIAPVAEEILFRLFLQGWLESLDRRLRRFVPGLRRCVRWGTLPVVVSSLLFAAQHVRGRERHGVDFLLFMMIGGAVVQMATAAFAVGLARLVRGATAADLGFVRERVLPDVGLGLAAFGGIAAPLFALQLVLLNLLPAGVTVDAFSLFPFAVLLGAFYCRTHRIVPSIAMHAALNTTSLTMLWLQTLG